jgi:sec-independent protein translocase protein TatA
MVGDILQPTHLLFILVVALLVLGPKRLPEVGRTLGSGLRDFRQAINGESNSHDDHEPSGYVETEPEIDTGPAFADEQPTATAVEEHDADEPSWTPSPETDTGPAFSDDADAEPSAETTAVQPAEPAPEQTATASSSGFASALAASRRQPADDSAGDE